MKFLCLIFLDERVLDDLSKRQYDALVDESLAYDERLRESRHFHHFPGAAVRKGGGHAKGSRR